MASLRVILLHRHYSWFIQFLDTLSALKRCLKAMNIRRHDELIGPNDVIEAVSVSYFNERPTNACLLTSM